MSTGLDEQITISLEKGTLLVLFEFLARSNEGWRASGNKQLSNDTLVLAKADAGECVALWRLEAAIERMLPEVFAHDYKDLIAGWKQKLTSE